MARSPALFVLLSALALPANGETLVVDGQVTVKESSVDRPTRGMTMASVEERFGAPVAKRETVGSPPITRWEYAHFIVVFEHDRVLHSVVVGS
jgi:hypothetical protein